MGRRDSLRELLERAAARPRHASLALRAFSHGLPLDAWAKNPSTRFPAVLLHELPAITGYVASLVRILSAHPAADGAERLLLSLADGQSIECVLLPGDGVCVSTQVGCAVGCVFCMTGREGLSRQLSSDEIVAQVALARARRTLRRVVFMGMGEPAHNLANVREAIELLGTEGGLGHKNLVFSTVGDRRVFAELPRGRVRPALALSLHTTRADLRASLLPRAPRIDPAELVELAEAYARTTTYPTQYQWTLLAGINDGDDELRRLAELLAGHYAVVNFIPYNDVEGLQFRRPPAERPLEMIRYLRARGVLAKLRRSAGPDVEAACGQLRSRGRSPIS
jgi:23S rRNA (adenine2503-C2)-methyltransferase